MQTDRLSILPMMVWTSKGSMHPCQFLRFPKWRSRITLPSTYLAGTRAWQFTASAPSRRPYPASTCCWSRRQVNYTTPLSRTSTAYSTTRASTRSASTSARDACTVTLEKTCWRPTSQSAKGSAWLVGLEMPEVGKNKLTFQNHHKQLLAPFISKVGGKVSCIPNHTERYISFSVGQLRFIDSAQFLLASLDKLSAANRSEAFQITAKYEPNEARLKLLMRKGVYPYEYMDSWVRFEETQLPPKEPFYRKLFYENINEVDYAHVRQIWMTFGCKTLGDYSDLYCCTEVLLLADVCEAFRKTCLKQYGLDPARYYTSPAQEDRRWARTAHRLRPAPVHRGGDARGHFHGVEGLCQSKQSQSGGLWHREAEYSHCLLYEQPRWANPFQ